MALPALLSLEPALHERVWGGRRLRAEGPPVGEAWIVHESNRVIGGPWAGRTLAELTHEHPEWILGGPGERFPLLIKLLDCADWLSVQVHPDDALAQEMVGPLALGKTEAWYFLSAEEGTQVIAGLRSGVTDEQLDHAVRAGGIRDLVEFWPIHTGDAMYMPARTLHALGPGLFLYEVQQTSDTTYRVWDWDRPPTAGRALHIEESVRAIDPRGRPAMCPAQPGTYRVLQGPYFALDHLELRGTHTLRPGLRMVTAIEGTLAVTGGGETATISPWETVLVAGGAGESAVSGVGRALVAGLD